MNLWSVAGVAAMALTAAGGAGAASSVDIRNAAAQVTIIPEARSDVQVSIIRTHPKLRLSVSTIGDRVIVDGGLMGRAMTCHAALGGPSVMVWGVGNVSVETLPKVVIHTPMDAKVSAGGAVFGDVGRAASADLATSGCGDWTMANVSGPLKISTAGSGDVRAGSAGSAHLRVSGSGDISLRDLAGGLDAATSGSGDVSIASVSGPFRARVAGAGDIKARGGAVTDMDVAIAGSGDVTLAGSAQSLKATIAGSGDVTVTRVSGPVTKSVVGSGDVTIGG